MQANAGSGVKIAMSAAATLPLIMIDTFLTRLWNAMRLPYPKWAPSKRLLSLTAFRQVNGGGISGPYQGTIHEGYLAGPVYAWLRRGLRGHSHVHSSDRDVQLACDWKLCCACGL